MVEHILEGTNTSSERDNNAYSYLHLGSRNICKALAKATEEGCKTLLISAKKPKIKLGDYKVITLDADEYHTSEVIALGLFYQLIHGAGFTCPTIDEDNAVEKPKTTDYTK